MKLLEIKPLSLVNLIPFFLWLNFMVFGFILTSKFFFYKTIEIQSFNIFLVLILLYYSFNIKLNKSKRDNENIFFNNKIIYLCAITCIVAFLIHLFFIFQSHIQLTLNIYNLHNYDKSDINKLLNIPVIFKYSINWICNIFFPLIIFIFFNQKKRLFSTFFLMCFLIYLLFTKNLFVIYNLSLGILIYLIFYLIKNKKLFLVKVFIILTFFIISHAIYIFNNAAKNTVNENQKILGITPVITLAKAQDNLITDQSLIGKINKFLSSKYYRFFFIPVDVSNKWYQYKIINNNKNFMFKYLIPDSKSDGSLSRKIGNWSYNKINSNKWGAHNNSNASFDADSYTRFGLIGFLINLIILHFFIIFIRKLFINHPISIFLYCLFIGSLANLSSWGLHSYFLSQGYIFILILFLYFNAKNFRLLR